MEYIFAKSKNIFFLIFFLASFFAGRFAHAQIIITEIMYDANGSDSGREWIEVYNSGNESINFSKWKFSEGNSNHGLIAVKGSSVISPGEYAIIADNPDTFKIDWPDFPGVIFDSAFSLSNAGEALALKDSSLNASDEVSYLSSWGANGDGKSLERADSKWGTGAPTPGAPNVIESDVNSGTAPSAIPASTEAASQKITATIASKNAAAVGEQVSFGSIVSDSAGTTLKNGKYVWNFGDGNTEENKNGGDVRHAYAYAGDYVAVFDYFQDEKSTAPDASARITMAVLAPMPKAPDYLSSVPEKLPIAAVVSGGQKDSGKNIANGSNDESNPYNQSAQALNGFEKSDTNIYFWLIALSGLIAASIGSVFFLKKSGTPAKHESDEIEIID